MKWRIGGGAPAGARSLGKGVAKKPINFVHIWRKVFSRLVAAQKEVHMTRVLWLLGSLVFFISYFGCAVSDLDGDPYSAVPECAQADPLSMSDFEPPQTCIDAFRRIITIDDSFSKFDDGMDNSYVCYPYCPQTPRLFRALYFLRNHPLSLDLDKSIWGVAPARQVLPQSLLRLFERHPDRPPNQILFNYLVQSVRRFKLGTDALVAETIGGFYTADRDIILEVSTSSSYFMSILEDAYLLVHESRHSETGAHQIRCPMLKNQFECDINMEGPHGWEFTYGWGVLQNNQIRALDPWEAVSIAGRLFTSLSFVASLGESARPLRDLANQYKSIDDTYQFSYKELIRREGLTPVQFERKSTTLKFSKDYYTEASTACSKPAMPSSSCQQTLDSLIGLDIGPLSLIKTEDKARLKTYLLLLLQYPLMLSPDKLFLGIIHNSSFITTDLQNLQMQYPSMSLSQIFFNYLLESYRQKPETNQGYLLSGGQSFLAEPGANLGDQFQVLGQLVFLARNTLRNFHNDRCNRFDDTPECQATNQPAGWRAAFLWAVLQADQQARKAGAPFLDAGGQDALGKTLCRDLATVSIPQVADLEVPLWSQLPPLLGSCSDPSLLHRLAQE